MNGLESVLEADAGDVDGDVRGGDNLDGELEASESYPRSAESDSLDVMDIGAVIHQNEDDRPRINEVVDSDDSRNSHRSDFSPSKLECRFFAFNLSNSEELAAIDDDSNESSLRISKDNKKTISEALKFSDVTLLVACSKIQSFIGYAAALRSEIESELSADEKQDCSTDEVLPIKWAKFCNLPFKETEKILNPLDDDKSVTLFQDGQEIDINAAEDVLFFMNYTNTEIETFESMKKLIEEAQLEPEYSEELIQDTAVDDLVEPESRTEQAASKKENSKKSNDKNHRDERNSTKRSRTDSIVSSSSTQGSETRKTGPTKRPSVSSNLPKPPRPKNMFDITDMSYEQYVDRHYALKYEQWFQETGNMNAGSQGLPGMPGMAPGMANGPGGMPLPLAMMVANMAMTGGGYYGGQGPGMYGPMGGPMIMAPPSLGMGMAPRGPNPMMMHGDMGMYQGMMLNDSNSGGPVGSNQMYGGERGRGGRPGGNSRSGR